MWICSSVPETCYRFVSSAICCQGPTKTGKDDQEIDIISLSVSSPPSEKKKMKKCSSEFYSIMLEYIVLAASLLLTDIPCSDLIMVSSYEIYRACTRDFLIDRVLICYS